VTVAARQITKIATFSSVLLLALVAASCEGCDEGPGHGVGAPCTTVDDCDEGLICLDDVCAELPDGGDGDGDADSDADADACPPARDCAGACCDEGQVCDVDVCVQDCGALARCGAQCCGDGEMCHEDRCVAACDDVTRLCGAALELCCGEEEACLGQACVPLGDACTLTEECDVDELCEPTLGRCVPRDAVEVCEYRPPEGVFSPVLACQWAPPADEFAEWTACEMTPSVANLTDDNGDGATDTLDIPDVVFVSYDRYEADGTVNCCTNQGVIRLVSGACNEDGTMTTIATLGRGAPWIDSSSGIALGNLHPDSDLDELAPEIVATFQNGGTVAFTRTADDGTDWAILWQNDAYITRDHTPGAGAQPQIVDLEHDGAPEVVIGNVVLDGLTGELRWDGRVTVGTTAGVGNNAFLGPNSTVADVDLDGTPEVIAGNTVYDGPTGALEWTYEYTADNSGCQGRATCDGFNAVANFDDDPEGEVVIVRRGDVYVLEHDGVLAHRIPIPWEDCVHDVGGVSTRFNEGGPPTVADFDGDGRPEIGTASADFYTVIDLDCTGDPLPAQCESEGVLWTVPNQDCSSRVTGSSVFDFDGNGSAEVVYADEVTFRVFDGLTGDILMEDASHVSNTRTEMPVVVDVDNDGKSEVVVPEPGNHDHGGIQIWEDAENNWVRTRRIWNQHSYHVTNVTEDGQIPRDEEENWSNGRLNNFRQNVQPAGLFDAPDLVVASVAVEECLGTGEVRIAVTVRNDGALGVPPGVHVRVTATSAGGETVEAGVATTTTRLLPGSSETLRLDWPQPESWGYDPFTVSATVDDDGTGAGDYNECDEANNGRTSDPFPSCLIG
jgi:hypothetical protein